MLSKAQIKYIRSLSLQKYRKEHNVFMVEGDKLAKEWLRSSQAITHIVATQSWLVENAALVGRHTEAATLVADESSLMQISSFKTPNHVLLVVQQTPAPAALPEAGWMIVLEQIQDPGNLGTIIRIADWFGIPNVVCSPDCAEAFSPKVIQAAMGGHLRVQMHTVELEVFLPMLSIIKLAAVLKGKSVYEQSPIAQAALLIGNESRGLSEKLIRLADEPITIPRRGGAESLNAAVSAGILCSHLMGGL